jgi:hypothetical protein
MRRRLNNGFDYIILDAIRSKRFIFFKKSVKRGEFSCGDAL